MRLQRLGLTKPFWKLPRMEIAAMIAATAENGHRVALRIIHLERQWIQSRRVIPHKQGRFPSIKSMLEDESTLVAIREYLSGAGESLSTQNLANAITSYWRSGKLDFGDDDLWEALEREVLDLLPSTLSTGIIEKAISQCTASTWLRSLGYKYREVRKGVYRDGHERPDVISYRQNTFLPKLKELEHRMVQWEEDSQGQLQIRYPDPELLGPNEKPLILITYDESTFDSNDGRHHLWGHNGNTILRKKSRGQGIMISDFLFPGGRLQAPEWLPTGDLPNYGEKEGQRISLYNETMKLEYGKGKWWEGDDLVEQVISLAIPIFESAFPQCQALFLFDNATSHAAYASDALLARSMNLRPGGQQSIMRNGFNSLTSSVQSMVQQNGKAKGLRMVLEERGLWRRGLRIQCRKPGTDKFLKTCLEGGQCCARALIAGQKDFQAQRCRLQEEVEEKGHLVLFYPKFHCELNFIEYFWGAVKRFTRKHCRYKIRALRQLIPHALDSVPNTLICRFWRRSWRIMEAYRSGIAYGTPEFKNYLQPTYRSHRRIPESHLM